MLIELGEYREAKLWADKALGTVSPMSRNCWPPKPSRWAAAVICRARLAFSDASIEERGDTPYVWLARGDVLLARSETRADYCFEKSLAARAARLVHNMARGAHPVLLRAICAGAEADSAGRGHNPGNFLLWLEQGHCQQAIGLVGAAEISFTQARQLNPRCDEADKALLKISQTGLFARLRGTLRGLFKR